MGVGVGGVVRLKEKAVRGGEVQAGGREMQAVGMANHACCVRRVDEVER